MLPSPNSPQQYRKDIDGLRALAVLLVVFCHMDIAFFTGGYIGVDVFFVISGFLITKIIYREMLNNNFSFQHFYTRRIKRLLPALIFVLIAACFAFSWILSPVDLQKFISSVVWVMLFVGNIYFWIHHGGYFGGNAKEAPLLHTWSLAIEEQFYFIWPVVLLAILRFLPAKLLPWLVLFVLAVLVYLSEIALDISSAASYYLLPTRFFELLIGATLAIWWQRLPPPSVWLSSLISAMSLLVIFYLAITLTEQSRFPGLNAFYVSIASALLIYCGQQRDNIVTRLLSIRPVVFIGLISYSLYLWHWPILVWFRYRGIELTSTLLIVLFVLMIFCAWFSWRFVEKPFRTTSLSFPQLSLRWFALPLGVIFLINLATLHWHGFPSRFAPHVVEIETALNSFSNEIRGECHSSFRERDALPSASCTIGAESSTKRGLLFGDSHANHFNGFFDIVAAKAGVSLIDYTMDQCPPIMDFASGESAYRAEQCQLRNNKVKDFIAQQPLDFVVLAASWPHYRSTKIYLEGVKLSNSEAIAAHVHRQLYSTLTFVTASGAVPIIVEDIAFAGGNDPKCTLKNRMFSLNKDCRINYHNNEMMLKIFDQLAIEFPKMRRVDVKDLYCDGEYCEAEKQGVPMYRDSDHLTHTASEILGSLYIDANRNIFR